MSTKSTVKLICKHVTFQIVIRFNYWYFFILMIRGVA